MSELFSFSCCGDGCLWNLQKTSGRNIDFKVKVTFSPAIWATLVAPDAKLDKPWKQNPRLAPKDKSPTICDVISGNAAHWGNATGPVSTRPIRGGLRLLNGVSEACVAATLAWRQVTKQQWFSTSLLSWMSTRYTLVWWRFPPVFARKSRLFGEKYLPWNKCADAEWRINLRHLLMPNAASMLVSEPP